MITKTKVLNRLLVACLMLSIGCGGSEGDKNKAPIVTFEPKTSINEDTLVEFSVSATDPEGDG